MPKIFLCYRREDSQWPAQLIYNNLVDHFGSESVVWDIDAIPLGVDFREYLNSQVSECDILLAVIGDQWLDILKQRIDETNDFVRIEIQAALEREIPVVPILIGGRSVPSDKDLPPELAKLSYKQAAEVRVGLDLQIHLKRLVDGLARLFPGHKDGKELKQKQVDEELKREEPQEKYINSIGMEFVLIPAGRFMMGTKLSLEEVAQKYGGKARSYANEYPQHEVTISETFYLQSTAVTQRQWIKVMGANPSLFQKYGDDCPVERVSWNDAQEFIQKLDENDDTQKHRLPTEAEWEYACRAGSTTEFSFGNDKIRLGKYAWFHDNSQKKTHPVGLKKPNSWGLYDMHGNVWEWVEDDYYGNYKGAPVDGSAWVDDPRRGIHVARGGSFFKFPNVCRSAIRSGGHTRGDTFEDIGFRLARSVTLGT